MIHGLYPPDLAEDWDNVGLQAGDPGSTVTRVLVSLDPTEEAVAQALRRNCQALLTHHPLILRPLKNITPSDETGRTTLTAIRNNISLIAAHTNLDSAPQGLNDWLAARLGVQDTAVLEETSAELVKLVVFVPRDHAESVAEAIFSAGAGHIGKYSHCSFRVAGTGSFLPGDEAQPYLGRRGELEQVDEVRFETILPRRLSGKVLDKMLRAHPYEEVAYDLYPLHNRLQGSGLGRYGTLSADTTLHEFALQVKEALGISTLRLVGDPQRTVRKVAVCGGSGASLLGVADRHGVDALVTGDIKYHEARQAEQRGIAVLDAGHFGTEHIVIAGLASALEAEAQRRGLELEFLHMDTEADPFITV